MNCVILTGNLGADPELRTTNSGTAVCNIRLATSSRWKDSDGDWTERTEWHKITVWGKRGEALARHYKKGQTLCVRGHLQTRKWEDNDGNTRYTTEVVADDLTWISNRSNGGGGGGDYVADGYGGGSSDDGPDPDIPF